MAAEYELNETVYYIQYIDNAPYVQEFLITAIRETDAGFEYSKYADPASPYKLESELFATIDAAVAYQVALLEALIPTP